MNKSVQRNLQRMLVMNPMPTQHYLNQSKLCRIPLAAKCFEAGDSVDLETLDLESILEIPKTNVLAAMFWPPCCWGKQKHRQKKLMSSKMAAVTSRANCRVLIGREECSSSKVLHINNYLSHVKLFCLNPSLFFSRLSLDDLQRPSSSLHLPGSPSSTSSGKITSGTLLVSLFCWCSFWSSPSSYGRCR